MYGVVILNYNTAQDALLAAQSVIDNATNSDFCICVVDNASSKANEKDILTKGIEEIPNTELLFLDDNLGYAHGNNEGVKYLISKYDISYVVIMNPDVLIIHQHTIDHLLERLSKLDKNYCGIQPIVWTPYLGDGRMMTNIRRVPTYKDTIIEHFFLFKRVFKKTYGKSVYYKERPYDKEMDFEVPSGAFFIMRTNEFVDVDYFDENTFLYNEELILGYKFKLKGYKFRFMPSEEVRHDGGKSTGSNAERVKWNFIKFGMQSNRIYLKDYLHCNFIQIWFVDFLMTINFLIKKILKS